MLKIRGKTFLEYQLELLKRAGIKNIVLCIGHMGEQIESLRMSYSALLGH